MQIDILTLFPEMCDFVLSQSVIGRARKNGIVAFQCVNIREYTLDKHRRVDDYPYGGGQGMIMQADPIARCYDALYGELEQKPHFIYMSPQGRTLTQQRARELSHMGRLSILCGHYEGVDERLLEEYRPEEISIGDYVLTGGELPAMVLADTVCRLIPGVLAAEESFAEESHYNGLLEFPQYTRPAQWRGREVPEVLINGHHQKIEDFRRYESLKRTFLKRPELLESLVLTEQEQKILDHLSKEIGESLCETKDYS